jgi:hypothetical protein
MPQWPQWSRSAATICSDLLCIFQECGDDLRGAAIIGYFGWALGPSDPVFGFVGGFLVVRGLVFVLFLLFAEAAHVFTKPAFTTGAVSTSFIDCSHRFLDRAKLAIDDFELVSFKLNYKIHTAFQ